MSDLLFKADVLAPDRTKVLKFTGHRPSRFIGIIPPLMKSVFRLSSSKFYEDRIKWDVSTDTTEFYGEWRAKDDMDGRSAVWAKIRLQGYQDKDKNGQITIYLTAWMQTKFPYSNAFDKALYLAYSRLFYSEQRRKYMILARRRMEMLENELKKELDSMVK